MCTFWCVCDQYSASLNCVRCWNQVGRLKPEENKGYLGRGLAHRTHGVLRMGSLPQLLYLLAWYKPDPSWIPLRTPCGVEGIMDILFHSPLTGSKRRGNGLLAPRGTFTAAMMGWVSEQGLTPFLGHRCNSDPSPARQSYNILRWIFRTVSLVFLFVSYSSWFFMASSEVVRSNLCMVRIRALPLACHVTQISLRLCFCICEIGIIIVPFSWGCIRLHIWSMLE